MSDPIIYDKFCASKGCTYYIEWEYVEDFDPHYSFIHCTSCQLIGQSHHIINYPDNCPFIEEIKNYKGESL